MTEENTPPPSAPFGERMAIAMEAFFRALIRLLVIVVLGAILGFAIFYGVPSLYRQFVQPVQSSITHLEATQALQEQINQQHTKQLEDFQNRLNVLEGQSDQYKQTITDLQGQLDRAPGTQQAHLQELEGTQAATDALIQAANAKLEALDKELADLGSGLDQTNKNLSAIATQVKAEDQPAMALRRELEVVKAMELLTRSRISLVGNNYGLAKQDVQSARDVLANLQTLAPTYQQSALSDIIARLDMALGNLPDTPVLAADDLEVAWQLLQSGLPGEPALGPGTITITPTPYLGGTASPTPTPTPYLTPTPQATGTPGS